jgi:uncharacterized protein YciI
MSGMHRLNLLANHREALDENAFDGRLLPCGPECLVRQKQCKEQI